MTGHIKSLADCVVSALRTGKIDYLENLKWEDAQSVMKTNPQLKYLEKTSVDGRGTPAYVRTDKPPFNDVRIRRALVMAIDYYSIRDTYYGGKGNIITYPYSDTVAYHTIYLGINDSDLPQSVKEMYTYNVEKSKQLLADAGYPEGFKTEILISTPEESDYYQIIKSMWAKVGVDLTLNQVEPAAFTSIMTQRAHKALASQTATPVAAYSAGNSIQGEGKQNASMLNDPIINNALDEIRIIQITDEQQAEKTFREKISKYLLSQAVTIPNIEGHYFTIWWPWLKNYSGERSVGYDDYSNGWEKFVWIDQQLKRSLGY